MEKTKSKKSGCCSCEADFKKEMNDLGKSADKPTKEQHDKKRSEVNAAFSDKKKK